MGFSMDLLLVDLTPAQALEVMVDASNGSYAYKVEQIGSLVKEDIIFAFAEQAATESFEQDYEHLAAERGRYYFIIHVEGSDFYGIPYSI